MKSFLEGYNLYCSLKDEQELVKKSWETGEEKAGYIGRENSLWKYHEAVKIWPTEGVRINYNAYMQSRRNKML